MRMTSTRLQFHPISQLFIIITIGISLYDKRPQKRLKRLNLARKNEKIVKLEWLQIFDHKCLQITVYKFLTEE